MSLCTSENDLIAKDAEMYSEVERGKWGEVNSKLLLT